MLPGLTGAQPPERLCRGPRRRKRKAFLEVTVPQACQSLGTPAASARPGPAFPSAVPMMHVTALAASPQAGSPDQTHHRVEVSLREGAATPRLSRGLPRRAGEADAGQAGGAEARHPAGQNTQAQRARLCWSILFQSCRSLSSRFSISLLNITKRGQRPALLGPSWGRAVAQARRAGCQRQWAPRGPGGHAGWPTSRPWGGVDSTPEGQRESYGPAHGPGETEHRRSWTRKERRFSEGEKERR